MLPEFHPFLSARLRISIVLSAALYLRLGAAWRRRATSSRAQDDRGALRGLVTVLQRTNEIRLFERRYKRDVALRWRR